MNCHTEIANGVFAQLMDKLGTRRLDDVPRENNEPLKRDWFRPEKGKSTFHKWTYPDCGLAVEWE